MPNLHDTIKAAHDAVDAAGRALFAHHEGERYGLTFRFSDASAYERGTSVHAYTSDSADGFYLTLHATPASTDVAMMRRRKDGIGFVCSAPTLADLHAAYTAAGNAWPFGEVV